MISEVLAVILSKPINFALDLLSFKVSFLSLNNHCSSYCLLNSSVSSKLGFNSFRLIKEIVKIYPQPNDNG